MSERAEALAESWVKLLAAFGITDYADAFGDKLRTAHQLAENKLHANWPNGKKFPDWKIRNNVLSKLVGGPTTYAKLLSAGVVNEKEAAKLSKVMPINRDTLMADFLSFAEKIHELSGACEPKFFLRIWEIVKKDNPDKVDAIFDPTILLSSVVSNVESAASRLLSVVPDKEVPFDVKAKKLTLPSTVEGFPVDYALDDDKFFIDNVSDKSVVVNVDTPTISVDLEEIDESELSDIIFPLFYYAGLVAVKVTNPTVSNKKDSQVVFVGSIPMNAWLNYRNNV